MATTYTTNYHLGKQTNHADKFDMSVITDNADKIDAALKKNADDISDDRAALVELVDGGAKNIFKQKATIAGDNTVNVTQNADGSITLNTSAPTTATAYIYLNDRPNFIVPAGTWVLSGVPAGYTGSQVSMYNNATWIAANGEAGEATFTEDTDTRLIVRIASGTTLSNFTIKPMVCTKAAWDISQQYVPYRPNYDELIARIEALEGGV